jgi:SAM-dependent methyltransferase
MTRERRLVFGEVAELYDRYRPAYPERLVDDLVRLADLTGGQTVLEVGAGTGKATAMLAARGFSVLAVEPSEAMVAVARRHFAACPAVRIEQSDFESWDPVDRRFPLVFCAQAWHWVDPDVGYARARSALSRGGLLAVFWSRPQWEKCAMRGGLLAAYERATPHLAPDGPMHPANTSSDGDGDWERSIAAAEGFVDAEVRTFEWYEHYSASAYVGLLATMSEVRLLDEDRREALVAAVKGTIESFGGVLILPMTSRLCSARSAT